MKSSIEEPQFLLLSARLVADAITADLAEREQKAIKLTLPERR